MFVPPYAGMIQRSCAFARGRSSSAICSASSLVGANTSAVGAFGTDPTVRTIMGIPKAMVLPDPVGARAQISLPAKASGIAAT